MPGYDYEHKTQKLPNTTTSTNFNFKLNLPPPNLTIPKNIIGANTNNDLLHNENPTQIKNNIEPTDHISNDLNARRVPNIGHIEPFVVNNKHLFPNIGAKLLDMGNINNNESESEESKEPDFVPEKVSLPSKPRVAKQREKYNLKSEHFTRYLYMVNDGQLESLIRGLQAHLGTGKKELKQPTKQDVIDYLSYAIFQFYKAHQYSREIDEKIEDWLDQIKEFFAWTRVNGIYKNIASSISAEEIFEKFQTYRTEHQEQQKEQLKSVKKQLKDSAKEAAKKQKAFTKENPEQAKLREQRTQILKTREQKIEEEALREPQEPENEIEPQAIDPAWIDAFIQDLPNCTTEATARTIGTMMYTFKRYIGEYNILELTKRDISEFITKYIGYQTLSSIATVRSEISRLLTWLLDHQDQLEGHISPDIKLLIPSYVEIKRFGFRTTVEGNRQLQQATFNKQWFGQCLRDIKEFITQPSYDLTLSNIRALMLYLTKNVQGLQINPSHILDFFITEKSNILEECIHKYIASYQELFRWTSIKKNEDGTMYYPNIIGEIPKRGVLYQLIHILKNEYDRQAAAGHAPRHPTSEYFNRFMATIEQPDVGRTPITLENFIDYLRVIKNIRIPQ